MCVSITPSTKNLAVAARTSGPSNRRRTGSRLIDLLGHGAVRAIIDGEPEPHTELAVALQRS